MRTTTGYRAIAADGRLEKVELHRRELRADDVAVAIAYCGVCHSDLHALHTSPERGGTYPLVPGHEFVGTVAAVGPAVNKFAPGDPVAVGNIVDSCGICDMCRAGQENFCREYPTLTYGGTDRHDGAPTLGAYAGEYVVRDRFVHRRPANLDPAGVAPLLCAGVTVWEPLRRWNAGPGVRVGVVGLGGLGHLAVKFAHALGAQVTVFTTSPAKALAANELGAGQVVLSTDETQMAGSVGSQDLIIDCVSAEHDLAPLLQCLALDGTLCSLGYLGPLTVPTLDLLVGRKSISSAGSGGLPATREMLDFCARHNIVADVEVLPSARVAEALDRLSRNDVKYRFVLDLSDL